MLTMLCRNFREISEAIGARLLAIKPASVAALWHVALLHLYRYCCLHAV